MPDIGRVTFGRYPSCPLCAETRARLAAVEAKLERVRRELAYWHGSPGLLDPVETALRAAINA